MTCWGKKKEGQKKDCLHLVNNRALSLPATDSRPSGEKEWKGNKWLRVFVFCCWAISHALTVFDFMLFFLLKVVTLSHAEAPLCRWELLHSAGCTVALQRHASSQLWVSAPQSSFRLPVTLFTISSSPMMARTVREPDSTCQRTRGSDW